MPRWKSNRGFGTKLLESGQSGDRSVLHLTENESVRENML